MHANPKRSKNLAMNVPRIGVGPMSKYTTSVIMSAAVSVATFATAHAQQTVLTILDNDSVYIDAKSFQVVPGREKATPKLKSKICLPGSWALGQSSYVRATSST